MKFGDIFKYKEKDYVYLAHTQETLYSALILDDQMSEKLRKMVEVAGFKKSSPAFSELINRPAYCFVELSTSEVKARLAHLGKADLLGGDCTVLLSGQLNKEDMRQIIKEIKIGPVPLILKDLTKNIVIED